MGRAENQKSWKICGIFYSFYSLLQLHTQEKTSRIVLVPYPFIILWNSFTYPNAYKNLRIPVRQRPHLIIFITVARCFQLFPAADVELHSALLAANNTYKTLKKAKIEHLSIKSQQKAALSLADHKEIMKIYFSNLKIYLKIWVCKIYLDFGVAMALLVSTNSIWLWREFTFLNAIP